MESNYKYFKSDKLIKGEITIRPRYNEVDHMGYVYHANYVSYCHQARTELLREMGIHDKKLEDQGFMLPVIEMNLRYLKPAHYDEEICIKTYLKEIPKTRFYFEFEILRENEILCRANSTLVFADKQTRKPLRCPYFILNTIKSVFEIKKELKWQKKLL